jgi:hypothetical protein
MDELAKLNSSQAVVPAWIFLQKLHEPNITKALAKASKMVESSKENMSSVENIPESPKVMELHSDYGTPFMIYLMTGGLLEDKDDRELQRRRAGHYTLVNDELFQ